MKGYLQAGWQYGHFRQGEVTSGPTVSSLNPLAMSVHSFRIARSLAIWESLPSCVSKGFQYEFKVTGQEMATQYLTPDQIPEGQPAPLLSHCQELSSDQ